MIDRGHPGIDTYFGSHAVDAETVLLIDIRRIHAVEIGHLNGVSAFGGSQIKSGLAVIIKAWLGDDGRKNLSPG
ncbi:Uncharacterised protein [Salmonella enterica subsp. enterica]|nr:Uncharacterised protein [Salmonella enterica subsp. enterica]